MVKLCGYAPYPVWVNANGHEWVKRQLSRAGVGFAELDNGLACCDEPAAAHRICARDCWSAPVEPEAPGANL